MAQTSVKSTALEQAVSLRRDGFMPWISQQATRYGLLWLCIILIIVFLLNHTDLRVDVNLKCNFGN